MFTNVNNKTYPLTRREREVVGGGILFQATPNFFLSLIIYSVHEREREREGERERESLLQAF